jgi:tetratricopeptide (TPR) repeat protein
MDKNSFGRLMDTPGALTPEEWGELRRERDSYPFAAPLQVLSLLADKANGAALWEQQALPRVLLYVQHADRLYGQLEELDRPSAPVQSEAVAPVPEVAEAAPATKSDDEAADVPFDVLQAINSYQEVSFKTAPKSVILSNFLEKDGGITLSDNGFEEVSIQELAKKSIAVDDSLESETLALVLEKQGKYAQALAMYEKLILNNPEKSSTFAVRIAALRTLLSENTKKK